MKILILQIVQVKNLNFGLLKAFAIATFAKTATKGTTMMPDPNSLQISINPAVWFLYSISKGGNENAGTPGATFPIYSIKTKPLYKKKEKEKILNKILPESLNGGFPAAQKYAARDVSNTIIAFLAILKYQIPFLTISPLFVSVFTGIIVSFYTKKIIPFNN